MDVTVNGTVRSYDGDPDMPLLWFLRDDLRLTGTRFGCGAGLCGACTVHVDGRAVRSCQTRCARCRQEGDDHRGAQRQRHASAAARLGHAQRAAVRLLPVRTDHAGRVAPRPTPNPTEQDIDRTMAGNICRCGTYQRIRAAIKRRRGCEEPEHEIDNVSRRQFLGGVFSTGAFVLASQVLPRSAWAQDPAVRTRAQSAPLNPSVYLGIEPDGTVFIVTHRSEMGTGIRTTLPLVAADELDADWSRVRIEQGLGDTKYGDQNTDGSRSIRDFYEAFRQAGAAASRCSSVPPRRSGACPPASAPPPTMRSSTRRAAGARVTARSCRPRRSCPCRRRSRSAQAEDGWKFVGQERSIYDLADITTGKAPFGLDIYREGMVFASIEHPPVVGGWVTLLRRRGDEEGQRRDETSSRSPQAAVDVPVARRRGGGRQQHVGGVPGPERR